MDIKKTTESDYKNSSFVYVSETLLTSDVNQMICELKIHR